MSEDGKYQKHNLIGSGERVDVFEGLNVAFDRKVAIKELRGGVNTSDAERTAFYSEYEKWAKLGHLRISRIADIDRTRAWVIQEYLPESILDRAEQLSSSPHEAYTAFEQLFEGLEFLHSQGLMHCNLKASNIRFSDEGLKICDGRCVPLGFPGSLPKPRGSNRYLAPEMINQEFGSVGTASDIYVAGVILLETLSGERFDTLFQGYVSGTPDAEMGWVRWHNSPDQLEPIHSTVPSIPKPLADLLDGMLCKEVKIRHASAERLLTELRAAREEIVNAPAASPGATSAGKKSAPETAAPGDSASKEQKVKLIDRPASPVYLRCLSGPLAGSIFPLPMGDVLIGTTEKCNPKLSPEQYPKLHGREVRIALGTNGWQISDSQGHPVTVDFKKSFEPAAIRSGSIFRLSSRGPDFQFIVQGEHEQTWQDVASKLKIMAPETHSVPQRLLKGKKKPKVADKPAAASAAKKQTSPTAASAAPAPPPPQPVAGKTKKPKVAKTVADPARADSAPAVPTPPKAAAPASSSTAPAPVAANEAAIDGTSAESKESFLDGLKNMDTNKRNNLILIVGLPIIAILIILFMPRSGSKDKPAKDNPPAVAAEPTDGPAPEKEVEPSADSSSKESDSDEIASDEGTNATNEDDN